MMRMSSLRTSRNHHISHVTEVPGQEHWIFASAALDDGLGGNGFNHAFFGVHCVETNALRSFYRYREGIE